MKLTLFFLLASLVHVSASVYSQQTKLSISMRDVSVKEVLKQIEDQSEFSFLYKNVNIDLNRIVSVDIKEKSVENLLSQIFHGTTVTYEVVNRQIVLIDKGKENSLSDTEQQQKKISGKISDSTGSPLPGVSVVVKGTTNGVITDIDGNFTIGNVAENSILQLSFVGMKSQEMNISGKTFLKVTLLDETVGIEEVVAVGYGTVKKSDLTGTVASVKTDKTADIPNTNILQAMKGSVSGMNVISQARPGEDPSINIRGINSLSAGNSPLIVVDGIIYNGSLNDFNVNDIEKIDILKDASASAVYGSRSSNGVIIITTKMGSKGKPVMNFNTYYGVSDPTYLIPMLDGPGYIKKILDFRTAAGLEADPAKISNYLSVTEAANYKDGKTINWHDKVLKTGVVQNYNLNISGQTDKTNYFLSGDYFNQEGIVDNDKYKRLTLKANFTNKITDWYSVSLRTSFSSQDYSGVAAGTDASGKIYFGISPYGSYWQDEAKGILKQFPMEDPYFPNPELNTYIANKDIRTSLLGTISSEMEIPFVKGLKWTLNYSTNIRNQKVANFWDNTMVAGGGSTSNGIAKKEVYENYDWTMDNIISYNNTFKKVHSVNMTLLYSREYQRYEATTAQGSDFFSQALGYNNLGMAKVMQTGSDLQDQNSVAYMGRLNYIFNSKYSLTATIRKDGFSGFSEKHKYATFPSAALAWTITNEKFLRNISWLNLLKVRVSYGENGNQALGRYQTLARISSSQYVYGDGGSSVSTSNILSMANADLGWETTKVRNLGIDFGFFKNRLTGNIDVYSSNTFNILLNRNIPATSGYSTVWSNIGEVHNSGIELTLNSKNMKKNDFSWESGFVFSLNRNKIVHLLGQDLNGDGKEDDNVANSWFIGKPLGVIYGYKINGIYQTNEANIPAGYKPGDFRIVDTNKDGSITPDDRVILGSSLPSYIFSISNTFKYKNFSFYMLINSIQGGGKNNYYVGDNIAMHNVNNTFTTYSERFNLINVPYWTPSNPTNEFARINYNPVRPHPYLEDRSFVRIQDVSLSYQLDKRILDKLKLQSMRIYFSGKNLFTWTKWTGYDPENMTTYGDFPMLRSFTLGVDFKF